MFTFHVQGSQTDCSASPSLLCRKECRLVHFPVPQHSGTKGDGEQGDRLSRWGRCGQGAPQGALESGEGPSYPNHHPRDEELDLCVCGKTQRTQGFPSKPLLRVRFRGSECVHGAILPGTFPSFQTGTPDRVWKSLSFCRFSWKPHRVSGGKPTYVVGARTETGGLQQRLRPSGESPRMQGTAGPPAGGGGMGPREHPWAGPCRPGTSASSKGKLFSCG